MFGLGMPEIILTFLVIFLLFGPKALPQIVKGLGQFLYTLKKSMQEVKDEISEIDNSLEDKRSD